MRTSSTGPHVRDSHNAGVAKSTATVRSWARAVSRLMSWNGHAGWRVQIGSTPRALAVVGAGVEIIGCPGDGTFVALGATTLSSWVTEPSRPRTATRNHLSDCWSNRWWMTKYGRVGI